MVGIDKQIRQISRNAECDYEADLPQDYWRLSDPHFDGALCIAGNDVCCGKPCPGEQLGSSYIFPGDRYSVDFAGHAADQVDVKTQ